MKTIVKASNLSYKINEKKLFHSISFDVCAGSALYVAGGNGSGKTTLLRMILGISKPTRGSIESFASKDICFIGHKNALKQYLTVEDNLILSSLDTHLNLDKYLIDLDLNNSLDVTVANLSFGQQKKLALLRVFLNNSDLIILDEPCVGLDNNSQQILCSFINEEIKKDKCIIFSSHIQLDVEANILNLDRS